MLKAKHAHTGICSRYSCSNIKTVIYLYPSMYKNISAAAGLMYAITAVIDLLHKVVKISSIESSGSIR